MVFNYCFSQAPRFCAVLCSIQDDSAVCARPGPSYCVSKLLMNPSLSQSPWRPRSILPVSWERTNGQDCIFGKRNLEVTCSVEEAFLPFNTSPSLTTRKTTERSSTSRHTNQNIAMMQSDSRTRHRHLIQPLDIVFRS